MSGIIAAPVAAGAVLTATGNFASNDTILIGARVLKFEATPAALDDIDVGADLAASLENLEGVINGDFEVGEAFAGTLGVEGITAVATATTLIITADMAGAYGNSFDFREGVDGGGTFSMTTVMSGGTGDLQAYIDSIISGNQLNSEAIEALSDL